MRGHQKRLREGREHGAPEQDSTAVYTRGGFASLEGEHGGHGRRVEPQCQLWQSSGRTENSLGSGPRWNTNLHAAELQCESEIRCDLQHDPRGRAR